MLPCRLVHVRFLFLFFNVFVVALSLFRENFIKKQKYLLIKTNLCLPFHASFSIHYSKSSHLGL